MFGKKKFDFLLFFSSFPRIPFEAMRAKKKKKFDEFLLKFWDLSGAKDCKSCRSRKTVQKPCKMTIWLLSWLSIQPRTSPLKFDHFVVKSEKASISNFSNKVRHANGPAALRYRREGEGGRESGSSPRQLVHRHFQGCYAGCPLLRRRCLRSLSCV